MLIKKYSEIFEDVQEELNKSREELQKDSQREDNKEDIEEIQTSQEKLDDVRKMVSDYNSKKGQIEKIIMNEDTDDDNVYKKIQRLVGENSLLSTYVQNTLQKKRIDNMEEKLKYYDNQIKDLKQKKSNIEKDLKNKKFKAEESKMIDFKIKEYLDKKRIIKTDLVKLEKEVSDREKKFDNQTKKMISDAQKKVNDTRAKLESVSKFYEFKVNFTTDDIVQAIKKGKKVIVEALPIEDFDNEIPVDIKNISGDKATISYNDESFIIGVDDIIRIL